MTPRIAILGGNGLLGQRLQEYLAPHGALQFLPREKLDITNEAALAAWLRDDRPDMVINCAAYLTVDACEDAPEHSYAVNYQAPATLGALMAPLRDARLIHFSTDFVFDGREGGYDEAAKPHPLSVYGTHKNMADAAVLKNENATILRIASMIGAGPGKRDFVKALLARYESGVRAFSINGEYEISMATPQLVANAIIAILKERPPAGLYHCVASGTTSWHAIAKTAFEQLGLRDAAINPAPASAYPMRAARPIKSWLRNDKLAAIIGEIPEWKILLKNALSG